MPLADEQWHLSDSAAFSPLSLSLSPTSRSGVGMGAGGEFSISVTTVPREAAGNSLKGSTWPGAGGVAWPAAPGWAA